MNILVQKTTNEKNRPDFAFYITETFSESQDYKVLQFVLYSGDILLNQPVSTSISVELYYYKDSTYIQLYWFDGKNKIPVASQLEQDYSEQKLWFCPLTAQ